MSRRRGMRWEHFFGERSVPMYVLREEEEEEEEKEEEEEEKDVYVHVCAKQST